MKPFQINLVVKVNLLSRLGFVLIVLLACATCAITFVNTFDYYGNTRVIKVYEKRVQQLKQRSKKEVATKEATQSQQTTPQQFQQDKRLLVPMIEKSMFPLIDVLTRIESIRPDKVKIESLVFEKGMTSVRIVGQSSNFNAVSDFIIQMSNSTNFEVTLHREEVIDQILIEFELSAGWTGA